MDTRTLPFEIKSIAETGVIEGVISAFGGVDHVGDTIQPGAYSRSLKSIADSGRRLPLLYQHNPDRPIGVWQELAETQTHLHGRAKLTLETQLAQEAFALARDGALTGISIGFEVPPGGSKRDGNKRVLTEIDLWEASLVTFPADPKARVTGVKSIGNARDIAELLQEAGISGRKAKLAAGAAWKALNENSDDEADLAELAALVRASTARLKEI